MIIINKFLPCNIKKIKEQKNIMVKETKSKTKKENGE